MKLLETGYRGLVYPLLYLGREIVSPESGTNKREVRWTHQATHECREQISNETNKLLDNTVRRATGLQYW